MAITEVLIQYRKERPHEAFDPYAQNCGITEKTADRLIQSVVDRLNGYIELCRASLLPGDMKEKLEALMIERCDILSRQ